MGVHSLADGKPIKRAGFPAILNWEVGLVSYSEWKFVYLPSQGQPAVPVR